MLNTELILILIYLLILPLIGLYAKSQMREVSLREYYLAGGRLFLIPLIFTFYATQYSGNTLFGMAGKSYRDGPLLLFALVPGMMFSVVILKLIAKKLYYLSHKKQFITIIDFFNYRYNNQRFSTFLNILFILVLLSYVLTNFKAIGLLISNVSEGSLSPSISILIMAFFMAAYESIGGMRGVVITDTLQGGMLMLGCGLIFFSTISYFENGFDLFKKVYFLAAHNSIESWKSFDLKGLVYIISVWLLFASTCVYPHAIQRIYSAKNWKILKKSLSVILWLPLITTLPIALISLVSHIILPPASVLESDRIILYVIEQLSKDFPLTSIILASFTTIVSAAIMSTMDSAMLSVNASIINDIIRPYFTSLSNQKLTNYGKILSWVLILGTAGLAILLPQSIWSILVIKLEIMLQIVPALVAGLLFPKVSTKSISTGLYCGILTTIFLLIITKWSDLPIDLYGFHEGVIGFFINVATILWTEKYRKPYLK